MSEEFPLTVVSNITSEFPTDAPTPSSVACILTDASETKSELKTDVTLPTLETEGYSYVSTKKGGRKLCYMNNIYVNCCVRSGNGRTYWRCEVKRCPSRLITDIQGRLEVKNTTHMHPFSSESPASVSLPHDFATFGDTLALKADELGEIAPPPMSPSTTTTTATASTMPVFPSFSAISIPAATSSPQVIVPVEANGAAVARIKALISTRQAKLAPKPSPNLMIKPFRPVPKPYRAPSLRPVQSKGDWVSVPSSAVPPVRRKRSKQILPALDPELLQQQQHSPIDAHTVALTTGVVAAATAPTLVSVSTPTSAPPPRLFSDQTASGRPIRPKVNTTTMLSAVNDSIVDYSLALFVYATGNSPALVESDYFRSFVSLLRPSYDLPSSDDLSNKLNQREKDSLNQQAMESRKASTAIVQDDMELDESSIQVDDGPAAKASRRDDNSMTDTMMQGVEKENSILQAQVCTLESKLDELKSERQKELEEKERQIRSLRDALAAGMQQIAENKKQLDAAMKASATKSVAAATASGDEEVSSSAAATVVSATVSVDEARLIAVICCFLHVHPGGASVDYIVSYLSQLSIKRRASALEEILDRYPTLFEQRSAGVGASIERRWFFIGYAPPTGAIAQSLV